MTEIAPIRRQVVVPGPPSLAFEVWTEEIGRWWPVALGHSVYGEGSAVSFREGQLVERSPEGDVAVWGEVLEWQPPHRLAITWHPGGTADKSSRVEVTFVGVAEDSQTLVTLSHHGWEVYGDPVTARAQYNQGWPSVLDKYVARVAPAEVPAVEGPFWLVLAHALGPAAPSEGSVFAHPLFGEHIAFLRRLSADGVLVAAGSLADSPGSGMTIIRVPEPHDIARYTRLAREDDRSVADGLFLVRVRPWSVALSA